MSYEAVLRAAGATVLAFEHFGSYQGDWWAHVEYDGKRGYVHGSFGSCSHCDAYQSEIGDLSTYCEGHYSFVPDCYDCRSAELLLKARSLEMGESYLSAMMTYDAALAEVSRNLDWDSDAEDMVKWIKEHADEKA